MDHLYSLGVAIPVNLPWNGEATVIGVLIVVVLLISFGVLRPMWYSKRLDQLHDHEVETNERLVESVQQLTQATKKITEVGESVERVMSTLQQKAGNRE